MSTKEQERKALEQITNIIAMLGENSYIGTALEGCLEIAEENINNDFACSMKQNLKLAEKKNAELEEQLEVLSNRLQLRESLLEEYRVKLEKEEEWEDYIGNELTQDEYDALKASCVKPLHEEDAARYISDVFGFAKEKVEILNSRRKLEVNRHGRYRYSATEERLPYYYATDYNYIRFTCCGYTYEAVNGDIHNVTC